jgi:hypothetical protein
MNIGATIPAGSMVPDDSGEATNPGATPQPEQEQSGAVSIDELSKQLSDARTQLENAQGLIGRQGGELGELRQNFAALSSQLPQKKDEPEEDYDARISELIGQFDSGEVEGGEAMATIARFAMEKGVKTATSAIRSELEQANAQKTEQAFHEANPDFKELAQNGTLNAIMQQNPMHDQFSAYFAHKAAAMQAKLDEAAALAKIEGQREGVQMAGQKQKAGAILGKQGAGVRDKNQVVSYGSRDERKQGMLAALNAARAS